MNALFVDESKSSDYTMVAALVVPRDEPPLGRDIRSLVPPGQTRIYFTKASESRRHAILSQLVDLHAQAHVFTSQATRAALGRELCLNGLVGPVAELAHTRIVDLDVSIAHTDRRILIRGLLRRSSGG